MLVTQLDVNEHLDGVFGHPRSRSKIRSEEDSIDPVLPKDVRRDITVVAVFDKNRHVK